MANKYAQSSGNWSSGGAGGIWYDSPTGGNPVNKPTSGDNAYILGGVAVTADEDISCELIRPWNGSAETNGALAIPASTTRTIVADLYGGSAALITISGSTPGVTLKLNGTLRPGLSSSGYALYVTGGSPTIQPTTGGAIHCVGGSGATGGEAMLLYATSTATITSATGGSAAYRIGARIGSSANLTVTGDVTGGTQSYAYGLQVGGSSTAIVQGTVVGGSAAYAFGMYVNGTSADVTIAVAKGGSHVKAAAVCALLGTVTILDTDLSGAGPIIGGATYKLGHGVALNFQDSNGARVIYAPRRRVIVPLVQ